MGNKKYEAVCTAIEYEITYHLDGGSLEEGKTNPSKYTIEDTFTLNNPVKVGHTFTGWEEEGVSGKKETVTVPVGTTGNKVYTAKYSLDAYTLTIDPAGGTYEGELVQTNDYGTIITIEDAAKNGYTFTDWTLEGAGLYNNKTYTYGVGNGKLTANYTLNEYDINYDYSSCGLTNEEIEALNNRTKYTVEMANFQLNEPNKYGYIFDGWTGSNGNVPTKDVTVETNQAVDLTYVANCHLQEFTVTFKDGESILGTKQVEYNHKVTPIETPQKNGYSFDKWLLNGEEYNFNNLVTEDITLQAKFDVINYTIEYDGITEEERAQLSNKTSYNIETESFNLNNPSDRLDVDQSGEVFIGWQEENETTPSMLVTLPDVAKLGNKKYTAKWNHREPNVYNITYNLNEGTLKTANPSTYKKSELPITLNEPIKEGHTFTGWTGSNGTTPEKNYKIPVNTTGDLNYIANYNRNQYTVEFYNRTAEGGYEKINDATLTKLYGDNIVEDTKPTAGLNGYSFKFWSKDKQVGYQMDSPITENIKLYAMYDTVEYDIDYVLNGGTNDPSNPSTYTIESDDIELKDATKTGYTFKGWTGNGTTEPTKKLELPSGSTGDKEFTANFEVNTYEISYDYSSCNLTPEEIAALNNTTSYTIETANFTLNNPNKYGYVFNGWSGTDLDGSTNTNVEVDTSKIKNLSYVANCALDKYEVEFYNMESDETTYTKEKTVSNIEYGSTIPQAQVPTVELLGYTFEYWSLDKSTKFELTTPITEDTKLYAVYSKDLYNITYNLDGGVVAVPNPTQYSVDTASFTLNPPTKEGFDFKGWSGTDLVGIQTEVTLPDLAHLGDKEFTANYDEKVFTVNFYRMKSDKTYELISTASLQKNYGSDILDSELPSTTDVDLTGYTFNNKWLLDSSEGTEYNIATPITSNINLYADYTKDVYTITYNLNEGTVATPNPTEYSVDTPTFQLNEPTKVGHDFIGWTGSNGTNPLKNVEVTKGTTGNLVFTANYEPKTFTVLYKNGEDKVTEEQVIYNHTAQGTSIIPTRPHGIFNRWVKEDGTDFDFATLITEDITLYAAYEEVVAPTITHLPTEWERNKVTVTITSDHDDYTYMFKVGSGDYQEYTGPFDVTENTTVTAYSVKNEVTSIEATHIIDNIDKINPLINDLTPSEITPVSIPLSIHVQDNESGIYKVRIYIDTKDLAHRVYESDEYIEDLNDEKEIIFTVTGLEELTDYTVIVEAEDRVHNLGEDSVVVTTGAKHYVARVVGPTYDAPYNPTDRHYWYETLEEALESETCQGASCVIQMLDNVEETNEVLNGQDVTIDLNGLTITGAQDKAFTNNGILKIVDKNQDEIGKVYSEGTAIINNGKLYIGEDETVLVVDPNEPIIEGTETGIDSPGELHFLDGKIIGSSTSGALKGTAPITPYSYNASVDTTGGKEIATLEVIADAEARINSVYFTKVQEAVDASENGSYVTPEGTAEIMSQVASKSDYRFIYDENTGTLKNDNQTIQNSTAKSYIYFDLTNETKDKILSIDANISSQANSDIGYIHIKETKDASSYSDESGRVMLVSGTMNDNVNVLLEKGKKYYVHLGYYKNNGTDTGDDTFTINSITLSDYDLQDTTGELINYLVSDNDAHFLKKEDGSYINRNSNNYPSNPINKNISSYVKFDLTNEPEDKILYMDALVNTANNYYAYVTVTNSSETPPYDQAEGKQYLFTNVSKPRTLYEIRLTAGQENYVHFGAFRPNTNSNDIFNIYSLKLEDELTKEHLNSDITQAGVYYMYETDSEPNKWKDLAGNYNVITNRATWDPDINSYELTSADDYAYFANNSDISFANGQTIEVEYSTTSTAEQYIYQGTSNQYIDIALNNGILWVSLGRTTNPFVLPAEYNDGNKHNIKVTYDSGTYKAYFDGVELNKSTVAGSLSAGSYSYIGRREGNPQKYFVGSIFKFKMYNRTATDEELAGNMSDEGLVLNLDPSDHSIPLDNPVFINNNQYFAGTTADSYMTFDLTGLSTKTIYVNCEVSSQANYDFGYVYVNDNPNATQTYQNATNRYVYISGEVAAQEYPVTLTGGKVNYLHFAYYKNNNTDAGKDTFKINYIRYFADSSNTEPIYIFSNTTSTKPKNPEIVINEDVDTIELLRNVTVTDPLEVEETREAILDLKGYTLTTNKSDYVINNRGHLTIIDSDFQNQKDNALAKLARETAEFNSEYTDKLQEKEDYVINKQNQYNTEYNEQMEYYNQKKADAIDNFNALAEEYLDYMNSDDYPNIVVNDFDYTGGEQTFTAPITGTYKLETWGAQGENSSNSIGGYGSYSTGTIELNAGDTIYINVGGQGSNQVGGYNGGGSAGSGSGQTAYAGGGATSITTDSGLLSSFETTTEKILIVSGGGGGAGSYAINTTGGHAGGKLGQAGYDTYTNNYNGYNGTGASQTEGGYAVNCPSDVGSHGTFGQGGNFCNVNYGGAGGGGGYYGGGGSNRGHGGAGGGSGYIGNNLLTNKEMVVYSDSDSYKSNDPDTFTSITNVHESNPLSRVPKEGNGFAKITYSISGVTHTIEEAKTNIRQYSSKYTYTGNYQEFTAPITAKYKIEAWGASGGAASTIAGGSGGYTSGTISLTKGDKLYIYVGEKGNSCQNANCAGGYNGGGNAYSTAYSGSGGGASDIRLVPGTWDSNQSLASRIMVAGAGGGSYYYNGTYNAKAGSAGGLTGYSGTYRNTCESTGGTQTSGGTCSRENTADGSFGQGGNLFGSIGTPQGGAGGSGYYGGAGGYDVNSSAQSGAGGSSYISGYTGSVAIQAEDNLNPKYGCEDGTEDIACSYHYSGKVFEDPLMISGNDVMPTHDGVGLMTGNTGNGYVKITLADNSDTYESPNDKYDALVSQLNVTDYFDVNTYKKKDTWNNKLDGNDASINGSIFKEDEGIRVNNINARNYVSIPIDNSGDTIIYSMVKVNQNASNNSGTRLFEIYSGLNLSYNTPLIYARNNQICIDAYNNASCSSNIDFNEYNLLTMVVDNTNKLLKLYLDGDYVTQVAFSNYGNKLWLTQSNTGTVAEYGDNTYKMLAIGNVIPTNEVIKSNCNKIKEFYSLYNDDLVIKKDASIETTDIYDMNDYITEGLQLHYDSIESGDDPTKWADLSGNNNDGTIKNLYKNGDVYYFNGSNGYVELTNSTISTPDAETVEITFRPTSPRNEVLYSGNSNEKIAIGIYAANNKRYLIVGLNQNKQTYLVPEDFYDGKDKNITVIYNEGEYTLYYNNQELIEDEYANRFDANTSTYIGSNRGSNYPFNGYIYNVKVYDRALKLDEIQRNYNVDITRYNIDAEIVKRVPSLDKSTITGNISNSSNSVVYNAHDAVLDVKQGIINVDKAGTSFSNPFTSNVYYGIFNDGNLKFEEEAYVNVTKNNQIGIYNNIYGTIEDSKGTVNLISGANTIGLYNRSNVDNKISGLTITSTPSGDINNYGIYESSEIEVEYNDVHVSGRPAFIVPSTKNEKITINNSDILSTGTGDRDRAIDFYNSTETAKPFIVNNSNIFGYVVVIERNTNYRDMEFNKCTMNANTLNFSLDYNRSHVKVNNSTLYSKSANIRNISDMTITDTDITVDTTGRGFYSIYNNTLSGKKMVLNNVDITAKKRPYEWTSELVINIGQLEINGGSIKSEVENKNSATIGIRNGDSQHKTAFTKITGDFETNQNLYYGISSEYGIVTIGENDGQLSTEYPKIMGYNNAIYNLDENNDENELYFYDGMLIGPKEEKRDNQFLYTVVNGTITAVATDTDLNYSSDENNDIYTLRDLNLEEESNYVAKIGSTKYTSIQKAVDAITTSSQTQIDIIKDIYTANTVNIPSTKNIVINQNNHKIKAMITSDYLTNEGTLHLTDNSNDVTTNNTSFSKSFIKNKGTLTYSKVNSKPYNNDLINNIAGGAVTINSGKLYGSNHYNQKKQVLLNNNGTLIINDGKIYDEFKGTYDGGRPLSLIINGESGVVTINDGEFRKYTQDGTFYPIINDNIMTVNGGTFYNYRATFFYNKKTLSEEDGTYALKILGGNYPYLDQEGEILLKNEGAVQIKNTTIEYARLGTNSGILDIDNMTRPNNTYSYSFVNPSVQTEEDYVHLERNANPVDTNIRYYLANSGTLNIKNSNIQGKVFNYLLDNSGNATATIENTKLDNEHQGTQLFNLKGNSSLTIKDCIDYTDPEDSSNNKNSSIRFYNATNNPASFGMTDNSNLTLENTSITRTSTSANSGVLINFNSSGNLIIKSGSYISKQSNAINNVGSGTLTIGEKIPEGDTTSVPSNTNPRIEGNLVGLNTTSTTTTVNFYDGRIVGTTAVNGKINNIETGYDILRDVNEESKEEKFLGLLPPIKNITMEPEKEYDDLATAFSEARTGDTLQVQREVTITDALSTIEIPANKKITLDFNGNKFIQNNTKLFINNGEFIFEDSTSTIDDNGYAVSDGGVETNVGTIVENNGKFSIESGTYFTTKLIDDIFINNYETGPDPDSPGDTIITSIFNINNGYIYNGQSILMTNSGILNINNGKVHGYKLDSSGDIYSNLINNNTTGIITVNGGSLRKEAVYNSRFGGEQLGYAFYNDGKLYINDGLIRLNNTPFGIFHDPVGFAYNDSNGYAEITGGTFISGDKIGIDDTDTFTDKNRVFLFNNHGEAYVKDLETNYTFGSGNFGYLDTSDPDNPVLAGGILTLDNVTYNSITLNGIQNSGRLIIKDSNISGAPSVDQTIIYNTNYGVANIKDSKIENTGIGNTIKSINNSTLNITDSTIINSNTTSNPYSLINMNNAASLNIDNSTLRIYTSCNNTANIYTKSSGDVNIKSGEVYSAYKPAIHNTGTGNINIGNKNDSEHTDFSTTNPKIEGLNYGIYNENNETQVNMYDGVIIGNEAVYGIINEIETGKHINSNIVSSKENITLGSDKTFKNERTSLEYETLSDALSAASDNDTITLLRNYITQKNTASITNTKKITLDLHGKSITVSNNKFLTNDGDLTIEDSTATLNADGIKEGTSKIVTNNGIMIENNKELTINSGIFDSNYILGDYIVNNYVTDTTTGDIISKITINNGQFKKKYQEETNYYAIIRNDGLLEINNGYFYGNGRMKGNFTDYVGLIMNTREATVNNGIFETIDHNTAIFNSGNMNIIDGTFKVTEGYVRPILHNYNGTMTVTGGNYNSLGTDATVLAFNTGTINISGITSNIKGIGKNTGTLTISNSTFTGLTEGFDNTGTATLTGGTYSGVFGLWNYSSGSLTINSSTITSTGGVINCYDNSTTTLTNIDYSSSNNNSYFNIYGNALVTMNSGTIKNTGSPDTYRNYPFVSLAGTATFDLINGTIETGQNRAVLVDGSSTINIGSSGGVPSLTEPSIYGFEHGLVHASATSNVYFYDGVIKGQTGSVSGTITDTEAGYKEARDTITEAGVTTINSTLTVVGTSERVAVVNNVNFLSLQSAVNYASNNGYEAIQLYKNVVLETALVKPSAGSNVKIYKGSYTIGPEEYYQVPGITVVEGTAPSASLSRFLANVSGTEVNPKNIIIFEMSDGNKLDASEIYKLYKIVDGQEKIIKVNEDDIGTYELGSETENLRTVDGKIYINGIGEGEYKLVSDNNREVVFTIDYAGVSNNIRENHSIKISRTTSAIATLILQLQTGMVCSPYILIIMILVIGILGFIAYQKYKKEEN